MSRGSLMMLLILDLLVMGGAGFIIWDRVKKKNEVPPPVVAAPVSMPAALSAPVQEPAQIQPAEPAATPAPVTKEPAPAAETQAKPAPKGPPRKILFKYNDVAARRVSIVGDFNQWSPKLMKKDAYGHWVITLSIAPGDYSYNFIVDGRMIRDPNNKRVKQSSQKIPSSFLSVGSGKKR